MNPIPLATLLPKIALSFVGRHESPMGSNRGPQIQEFFDATDGGAGKDGYPWCAAFVCRCVQLAMAGGKYTFTRPETAGAFPLATWSRKQDNSTITKDFPQGDIKAGDIVIYSWSHCGIAVTDAVNGHFETVEGNTNEDGSREGTTVMHKQGRTSRSIAGVRNRIRFTV